MPQPRNHQWPQENDAEDDGEVARNYYEYDPQNREPSNYNDGKGIRFNVSFFPIPDPAMNSKKRKNAPQKSKNSFFFAHELDDYGTWLKLMVQNIKHEEFEDFCFTDEDGCLPDDHIFNVLYTIARIQKEPLECMSTQHYSDMMDRVGGMGKPEVKIEVREMFRSDDSADEGDNEGDEVAIGSKESKRKRSSSSSQGRGKGKRKKTQEDSEEEEKGNIEELRRRHKCHDPQCNYGFCWVHPESGQHVFLDFGAVSTWDAAIKAGEAGVTLDNPPNSKEFDPARNSVLGRQRKVQARTAKPPVPSNSFLETAAQLLLLERASSISITDTPSTSTSSKNLSAPKAAHVPRISLDAFCSTYGLSATIKLKLSANAITGPHCLRFITDEKLTDKVGLEIGELADIRDAEERWALG